MTDALETLRDSTHLTVPISVRFTSHEVEQLDALAAELRTPRARLIRLAMREGLAVLLKAREAR